MWKKAVTFLAILTSFQAHAACRGVAYLNPQAIRGEGVTNIALAQHELTKFLAEVGLPVSPSFGVKRINEVREYSKPGSTSTPCLIYANPVIGFASGSKYTPLVVNMDVIRPAVFFIGKIGEIPNPKPKKISELTPDRQKEIRKQLSESQCHGMHAGVTTAIVYGQNLCNVEEIVANEGRGQSYLPIKTAMSWRGSPVGFITRDSSAAKVNLGAVLGVSQEVQKAELIIIPTGEATSWGYGLYVHDDVQPKVREKLLALFASIKSPPKEIQRVLDTDDFPAFRTPNTDEVKKMKDAIQAYLNKKD